MFAQGNVHTAQDTWPARSRACLHRSDVPRGHCQPLVQRPERDQGCGRPPREAAELHRRPGGPVSAHKATTQGQAGMEVVVTSTPLGRVLTGGDSEDGERVGPHGIRIVGVSVLGRQEAGCGPQTPCPQLPTSPVPRSQQLAVPSSSPRPRLFPPAPR